MFTIFLCDEATQNKSNIEMLNSIGELPAIITDIEFDPIFYEMLVENQQIIDLSPCFLPEVIESISLHTEGTFLGIYVASDFLYGFIRRR